MIDFNIFKMEEMLDYRRTISITANVSIRKRLGGIPFLNWAELFGLDKLRRYTYPCWDLHPVFVYKIVDELIYCEKKKILFRKF